MRLHELCKQRKITREDLTRAKRILIKVGTTVVTQPDGTFALSRLGNVVEEISELMRANKEVVLVSSGAVGKGSQKLHHQALLSLPLQKHLTSGSGAVFDPKSLPARACASAGQSGMMSLYDDMFEQKSITISQILLTENDFRDTEVRQYILETLENLIKFKVLPIINENDVISTRKTPIRDENNAIFWDNDSLAALIAQEIKAEVVILLTDVDGIYTHHPEDPNAEIISTYRPGTEIVIGTKSRVGRGGMQAKIDACLKSINTGVPSVIIASGYTPNIVQQVLSGKRVGTLFVQPSPNSKLNEDVEGDPRSMAVAAKHASVKVRTLSGDHRKDMLVTYANKLLSAREKILEANMQDLRDAELNGVDKQLLSRLKLTPEKLQTLYDGILQIAHSPDPIGRVLTCTELAEDDLILQKQTSPIGVLLVIFESRPDALPQLVALAVKSGNGLLLKGGKEAARSNTILHKLAQESIAQTLPHIPLELISLVTSREDIDSLLRMDKYIDLVIPRGSSSLVSYISKNTRIPVLGHAEGICHIYVHSDANVEKAISVIKDSKLDYPSACNALETLIINKELIPSGSAERILRALVEAKVELFAPANQLSTFERDKIPVSILKNSFHHEYSDTKLTVLFVEDFGQAIQHINTFGSGHTESIITEDESVASVFKQSVDSACVFHNASTRFADGYRFGLGAEVGISTSRIHARGPVGVDGLLTTKWVLTSRAPKGHIVGDFAKGKKYTHKQLPLPDNKAKL